jgi:hypothetical protein
MFIYKKGYYQFLYFIYEKFIFINIMGSQKTLTNEKYIYNCKEFQVYKTKKGVKLIKINNNFVNINNVSSVHSKINEKNHNDRIAENISELTELALDTVLDAGNSSSEDSIDGEEYILITLADATDTEQH